MTQDASGTAPDRTRRYHPFAWVRLDIDHIGPRRLTDACRDWAAMRTGGALPVWRTEVLESLDPELIRFSNVINIGSGTPPFSYRFFGSGLADMHAFELTNKTTDAIEPVGFRNLCVDQHLMTARESRPIAFLNQIPSKTPPLQHRHLMLRLPFADEAGKVSQILTLEEIEGVPSESWDRFRQE